MLIASTLAPPAAAAPYARQTFWMQAAGPGERLEAEATLARHGGRLVATYPDALLVELPLDAVDEVERTARLTALPDLDKIGHWRGSFDPLDVVSARAVTGPGPASDAAPGRGLWLVQFVGPPQDAWLEQLTAQGVELVSYFPHAAYLARLDEPQSGSIRSLPFVRSVILWSAALKFDPEADRLRGKDLPAVEINLVVFNPAREAEATRDEKNELLTGGFIVEDGHAGNHEVIRALVPSARLNALAALPNVIAVEAYFPPRHDDESTILITGGHISGETGISPPVTTHRGNGAPADWLTTLGVNGSNVTVGIVDDGVTSSDSHFTGRVTDILSGASAGGSGHGHHVASIVAGLCTHTTDPDGYKLGAGAAPGASILNLPFLKSGWFNACGTATSYGCLTQYTVTTNGSNGIPGSVQNNSWGSGSGMNPATYTSIEREYDLRVRDANESTTVVEPITIFFSAGNSGASGLTRPKSAKNIITTGASDNYRPVLNSTGIPGGGGSCPSDAQHIPCVNINMMTCFSSYGFVDDGRVKPDLVSPGADVTGARTNFYSGGGWGAIDNDHVFVTGTSQSSPATAGQGTLIVSKWRANNGGSSPSPAMVKAILINSADDIRTTTAAAATSVYPLSPATFGFPNNRAGWGRVNTRRHLAPGAVPIQYVDQSLANTFGSAPALRTFNYSVGTSSDPLYVTLVWTDAAAAINANPQLVNDLDLEVEVNGVVYLGNVLRGATGQAGKVSLTGGARDSKNNVENVFLPTVSAGQTITVRVRATAINGDGIPFNGDPTDQDFALVVYNAATCVAPTVPGDVAAAVSGSNRITVSWSAVAGATAYRVYRSGPGPSCAITAQTLVASVSGLSYDDTTVSGGSTYSYVVTAAGSSCVSGPSACASATATGTCLLPPTFAGLASVASPKVATCALDLSWQPATSNCSGSITYSIYRSTTPQFTPGAGNRIASGVTATTYRDAAPGSQTFYYRVRAVDGANGVEDTNSVELSGAPAGPEVVLYSEDFDALADGALAGFTTAGSGAANWRGVMACTPNQSPTKIFRFGGSSCSSAYTNSVDAEAILGGAAGLALPAGATNTRLSFWHRWEFESCCDGARLRIRRSGDSTFTNIPTSAFVTGSYGSNSWWTGSANTSMTNAVVNLDAACNAIPGNTGGCAGKTIFIDFHVYADGSITGQGWFLDQIRVTYDSATGCTPCIVPPGAPANLALTTPANNTIRLTWTAGNPAGTSYRIYREAGTCPAGTPALVGTTTALSFDDAGLAGGGTYRYVVRSELGAGCESPDSSCQSATATGPALGAPAQLVASGVSTSAATVTWSPVVGATRYVVERSADNVSFTQIGEPVGTTLTDSALTAGRTYIYRAFARDAGGNTSVASNKDVATTIVFTEDPLVAGVTALKAAHITQLRTAVDSVRTLAALGPVSYTDPVISGGVTVVKRAHIIELRQALDAALAALGITVAGYTDAVINTGGTPAKVSHVQELRNRAK